MTIESYCREISAVKIAFRDKIGEMKDDFLNSSLIREMVDHGDTILDESGLPFVIHSVDIVDHGSTGIAIELIGFRVLKSGHISKRGFVKMISRFNGSGECFKNKIVKVEPLSLSV